MRLEQCDRADPASFKSLGMCGGIADLLSPSNTAASSTHEQIKVSLGISVKDSSVTTWLDQRKKTQGQIDQDEALQRCFDCCTMNDGSQRACAILHAERHTTRRSSSVPPSNINNTKQMSRSWIDESSPGDALWLSPVPISPAQEARLIALRRRDAVSSVLPERLSPVPIFPAQEGRMIAEVPVNQSISLLEQSRSSPKKRATRNKGFRSKKRSSLIQTSNKKATSKTFDAGDAAHEASRLSPKDATKKHSAQEKPQRSLSSFKSKARIIEGLPRQVSLGSESLVKAGSCFFPVDSGMNSKIEWEFRRHERQSLKHVQEDATMEHLKKLMLKSNETQLKLQEWDKLHGLPKSHSQTMVNTSRSRRQLREGIIIPKWDGTPLINDKTELGKPKKRKRKVKPQEEPKHFGSQASRNLEIG
jgi:hypothetical protein